MGRPLGRLVVLFCLLFSGKVFADDQLIIKNVVTDIFQHRHGTGLLKRKAGPVYGAINWTPKLRMSLPEEYDLRTMGWVAAVRDQGQCGSCWAFSIIKTLESALLKAGYPAQDLSEQQVVSCAPAYGCDGGEMSNLAYTVDNSIATEEAWPYRETTGRCTSPAPAGVAKATRWGYCGSQGKEPTLDEIKQCLFDFGVQSVVVAAGGTDWSRGGDMNGCRTSGQNHMVNLGGWKLVNGKEKLIGRNSWGTSWGDKGDFYAVQGCDELASGSESVGFLVVEGIGPVVPHIQLPAHLDVHPGTEFSLGRRTAEPGVTYAWYQDDVLLSDTTSLIWVTPTQDTVFKVKATTVSGVAESSVEVKILATEFE